MITDQQRREIYTLAGRPHAVIIPNDDPSDDVRRLRPFIAAATEGINRVSKRGALLTVDIVRDDTINGFATKVGYFDYLVSVNTGIAGLAPLLVDAFKLGSNGPASVAASILSHYIIAHEMAHVSRGHLDGTIRPLCVFGADTNNIDEESVMDESDADAMAGLVMQHQLLTYKGAIIPHEHEYSLFLLSMLLLTEYWNRIGCVEGTHPHPYARLEIYKSGLQAAYLKRGLSVNYADSDRHALDVFYGVLGSRPYCDSWQRSVDREYAAWILKYFHRMPSHVESRTTQFTL